MPWTDPLHAGASLALFAFALTVAERCRPRWQPVAVLLGTAAAAYGTLCACRIISQWVAIRAAGLT